MEKDWDYIARLEKAIKQKYGDDAVQNPAKFWDEEKEKEYIEQLKELAKKQRYHEEMSEKVEVHGFLVNKKLLNKENKINCSVCCGRLKTVRDDIMTNKYDCCEQCYLKYVENREERWLKGWRPDNVAKNT